MAHPNNGKYTAKDRAGTGYPASRTTSLGQCATTSSVSVIAPILALASIQVQVNGVEINLCGMPAPAGTHHTISMNSLRGSAQSRPLSESGYIDRRQVSELAPQGALVLHSV